VEFAGLAQLVAGLRPAVVLEIGTGNGGTLSAWCRLAASNALIVSIDLPGGPFGGGYPESDIPTLLGLARPGQRVELMRSDSRSPETLRRVREILGQRPVDVLFIDGDHSYAGARRDFELYSPLVGTGGIIVFHDILPHRSDMGCEVERVWREVAAGRKPIEFVDRGDVRPRGNGEESAVSGRSSRDRANGSPGPKGERAWEAR
jgi:predicted O-methyltransferase YrrM